MMISKEQKAPVPVAIIGSGNIGTDLMMKIRTLSDVLELVAVVGVDPASDGLARAWSLGVPVTDKGIQGFRDMPEFEAAKIFFDATSAQAHARNAEIARAYGKVMIDLTPAAYGPFVVPAVNIDRHADESEVNMVTCGGQATVPIVAAVSSLHEVLYAEIVASIASKSAGPGTRANIDEFTETTAEALQIVGGAQTAKAIIVLNPAEPPVTMRDTVHCLLAESITPAQQQELSEAVQAMVRTVSSYVPGYRLKQAVQFEAIDAAYLPALGRQYSGTKVSVFLEIEGAGHYLPAYSGNLDIMTSAALQTAERIAQLRGWLAGASDASSGSSIPAQVTSGSGAAQ